MKLFYIFLFSLASSCSIYGQDLSFNNFQSKLKNLDLPFSIEKFNDFEEESVSNSLLIYNNLTIQGKGYIDHKGKIKKATNYYEYSFLEREHEKLIDKEYITYSKIDSVKVSFIGKINFNVDYIIILVKVKEVPDDFQEAYRYKLLSFSKDGDHISSIDVFEQIDDTSTKDWLQEKPSPNITTEFYSNSTFNVIWDEGYDEIFIQEVYINDNGFFTVKKLTKKED